MSAVLMSSVVSNPAQLTVVSVAADDPGFYWVFDFEETDQSEFLEHCAAFVALHAEDKQLLEPADGCNNEVLMDVGRLVTFLQQRGCPLTGSDSFQVGSPRAKRTLHKHRLGLAVRPGELAQIKL